MVSSKVDFTLPLPDDPKKWDGWKNYKSPNLYERLCLDPGTHPGAELIEEHCRELLRWWQKKLPLKNQPSNPLTQILRPGLDESSRYLTEARVELLDPLRRQAMDAELAARAVSEAVAEFDKFLSFAIADGVLTADEEKNLQRFGKEKQLPEGKILALIDAKFLETGARRAPIMEKIPPIPRAPSNGSLPADPSAEFRRMLGLSGLDDDGMTDDARDAFINMAENLGLDAGDAEDMVDEYLEAVESATTSASAAAKARVEVQAPTPRKLEVQSEPATIARPLDPQAERAQFPNFVHSLGGEMFLVPSGEFGMGCDAVEAAPNERPVTKVSVSRFYMARFLVTNAQFEAFDPSHLQKRISGADGHHPVVHVSSLDAIKYCAWLTTRERKKYRLPTEAEWEYAARGTDGRKFPWGNLSGRGNLANFADRNTVFAWSNREIDDGYAESSPVGSYPLGASPFGMEDMAGNVWEWCQDFFESYRGSARVNPRGPTSGAKRIYRGGSWKSRFNSLRTTVRSSNAPGYSCNDLGFRVVCECE